MSTRDDEHIGYFLDTIEKLPHEQGNLRLPGSKRETDSSLEVLTFNPRYLRN